MKSLKSIALVSCASFILFSCQKETFETQDLRLDLESAANNNQAQTGIIPNSYIVVFKDDVSDVKSMANQIGRDLGSAPGFVYTDAVKGFSITLPSQALEKLKKNPHVKLIEQDQVVNASEIVQTGATWGLDRINQSNLPLDSKYSYVQNGNGVEVYVIDTGIKMTHGEFEGRAFPGFDAISRKGTAIDGNGHGTHVAGTIGGKTYGVAKKVKLIAVRVLDNRGSGTTSGVIAGVDWVTRDHVAGDPAVANMSLGGGISPTLDAAVVNAIADGVVMCVAAGNDNRDAINFSPARVAAAITVGATDNLDYISSYSNYGSVVDINAPGTGITSAWYTSNTAISTISGTSMATPHVAGAAALYLQTYPTSIPIAVRDALVLKSTEGVLTLFYSVYNKLNSPNKLLNVAGF